jgi:putative PIN family toxin of toxin-antitoxin system
MRCVIDTNVYLSFLLNPFKVESPPTRVVQMIPDGIFDIIFPIETAAELRFKVSNKPSLRDAILDSSVEELIASLNRASIPVDFRQFDHPEIPDPKDVYLLDAVQSGGAEFLITGDKPLLRMIAPPKGTSIVTPAEFLMLLDAMRERGW